MRITGPRLRKLAAAAVMLAGTAIFWPRDSAETQIRALFDRAARLAAVTAPEHPMQKLEKAAELADLFTDSVSVRAELFGEQREISDKEQFRQKVVAGRTALSSLEVEFQDPDFVITGDKAVTELTCSIVGAMPGADGQFFEQHRLRIGLVNSGKWQIQTVEHLKNLRENE